ncbi:hypothetical protein CYY_006606 [Polysphondylium violaceum]|uniref:SET domain-containing protein n=1 Tax=Polysphondylium violaceum TaxID=133409 RepID=A0A8J4PZG0_9MYCE|nr:hypothetical protein CYY_006606 [Polysphondylium violaceum]
MGQIECKYFKAGKKCKFGDKCHFGHGKNQSSSSSSTPQTATSSPPLTSTSSPPQGTFNWVSKDISKGNLSYPLRAINQCDDQPLPEDFKFIEKSFPGDNVIPREIPLKCDCIGDCYDTNNMGQDNCSCFQKEKYYDDKGRLLHLNFTEIYECSPECNCSESCRGRVIQKGPQHPLELFKTKDKGWGVRAKVEIPARTYVCEYVGEIIGQEEAEKRGSEYDKKGLSYLFDLGGSNERTSIAELTIDATHFGNESRFINHSCDPNLTSFSAFIETIDERMPRIVFFSNKFIKINEELTFDYKYTIPLGHDASGNAPGDIKCNCGSKNCRKWLWKAG